MDSSFKNELKIISSGLTVNAALSRDRVQFNYRRYPLIHNQAMYVLSLANQDVAYTKNIEQLLGYDETEFTYDSAFSLIHPEDYPVVKHIVKSVLVFSAEKGMPRDSILFLTYRLKKKDGSYIRVQRTSGICRVKRNRTLEGNYSILQDISYMNLGNAVRWKWDRPSIDSKEFQNIVEFDPKQVFTPKQYLIFQLLKESLPDKEIGDRMRVKPSTIKTQKKRMLARLNCNSVAEMMLYFEKNHPEVYDAPADNELRS
jgi:DNA-binding CsgD family transcriptional regulator